MKKKTYLQEAKKNRGVSSFYSPLIGRIFEAEIRLDPISSEWTLFCGHHGYKDLSLSLFLYLLRIPCFSALLFLEVLFIQPSYDPVEPVSLQREPPLKVDRTPSSDIDNKLGNPLKSSWLTNILLFFFSGRFLIFSNCQAIEIGFIQSL